jgi:hypothetical protein
VESDVALVIPVLRIANRTGSKKKGEVASIPEGLQILTPDGVETLAQRTATWLLLPHPRLDLAGALLAHYNRAQPVNPKELLAAAKSVAMAAPPLRAVMYELPQGNGQQKRNVDPCPLSSREVEVLRRLAEGKGLQADRPRARALHEHRADSSAQHLREARRGRPCAGRPHRPRARLDLVAGRWDYAPGRGSPARPRPAAAGAA